MKSWCPDFFVEASSEADTVAGMGKYVVSIVFAIEHVIILAALAVQVLMPSEPEWVTDERARLIHEKDMASRSLRMRKGEKR